MRKQLEHRLQELKKPNSMICQKMLADLET